MADPRDPYFHPPCQGCSRPLGLAESIYCGTCTESGAAAATNVSRELAAKDARIAELEQQRDAASQASWNLAEECSRLKTELQATVANHVFVQAEQARQLARSEELRRGLADAIARDAEEIARLHKQVDRWRDKAEQMDRMALLNMETADILKAELDAARAKIKELESALRAREKLLEEAAKRVHR